MINATANMDIYANAHMEYYLQTMKKAPISKMFNSLWRDITGTWDKPVLIRKKHLYFLFIIKLMIK